MITTILFDLDGTLAPFLQDEFIELAQQFIFITTIIK